ncbi:MAG: hypothetical protein II601_02995 [Lachnospiraceae bacterium]|nr:hypothetical protein [Lachnospiraceae bacterium]
MKLSRRLFLSQSLSGLGNTSRMLLKAGHIPHVASCFLSLSSDGRFLYIYDHAVYTEKWFRKSDETVIGLASTRKEAEELVGEIISLSLKETGSPEPGPYLKRFLEESDA